ncbi:MAG: Lrp/AsnC ligand binding domain-containing protein [Hyphomicrobiaceae bacterium]
MVPFFVLVKCELGKAYEVASAIADAEIASEIYSISGQYDLMIKIYVEQSADIGRFVEERIHSFDGIRDTYTFITHRAF